jgi:hypothetical protein
MWVMVFAGADPLKVASADGFCQTVPSMAASTLFRNLAGFIPIGLPAHTFPANTFLLPLPVGNQ